MTNLFEVLPAADVPDHLELVRLGKNATDLQFFTSDGDQALLHYEDDQAVRSYISCPGHGCPLCFLGDAPEESFLLPSVIIKRGAVGVVRIGLSRSPGSLAAGLWTHLQDENVDEKLFSISRDGSRYKVVVCPVAPGADRNERAIKGYLAAREQGLKLTSALPFYTAAELAMVGSISRCLAARGGWKAPESKDETGTKAG